MSECDERCESCRWFYSAYADAKHGYCRIDPPVFVHYDEESGHARFKNPVVSPEGFCSHWEEGKGQ